MTVSSTSIHRQAVRESRGRLELVHLDRIARKEVRS